MGAEMNRCSACGRCCHHTTTRVPPQHKLYMVHVMGDDIINGIRVCYGDNTGHKLKGISFRKTWRPCKACLNRSSVRDDELLITFV